MNSTPTVAELQQKKLRVEREKAGTEAEIGPLTRRLDRADGGSMDAAQHHAAKCVADSLAIATLQRF